MIGFVMGTSFKFTPEVLGMTASSGLVILCLEVLFIKFGLYLLNSMTVHVFDVVAYFGYKYVGIVLTLVAGFLAGPWAYYPLMIFTSLCMAVFMVKTLRLVFPERTDANTGSNKKNYFLVGLGLLQFILQYYLSYDISKLQW